MVCHANLRGSGILKGAGEYPYVNVGLHRAIYNGVDCVLQDGVGEISMRLMQSPIKRFGIGFAMGPADSRLEILV